MGQLLIPEQHLEVIIKVIITLGTVLISVIAFFMKSLVTRLEKGNDMLLSLDKQMAIIMEKLEGYNNRITSLEHDGRKLTEIVSSMKQKLDHIDHEMGMIKKSLK